MSAPPPPPPPPGHEGIYKAPPAPIGWLAKAKLAAEGIASKAKEIDNTYALSTKAKEKADEIAAASKKAAADLAAKAKETDAKYEISKTAQDKTTAALSSVKESAVSNATKAKTVVAQKVGMQTPEERQQWLDTAVTAVSLASVFGGTKVKALAGAAHVGVRAANAYSGAAQQAGHAAAPVGHLASGAVTKGTAAPSSEVTEMIEVELVATVPAGGVMRVQVEGYGAFEVTVPSGVGPGDRFIAQIETPLDEPVPMGLPVDVTDAGGVARSAVPMAVPAGIGQQQPPVGALNGGLAGMAAMAAAAGVGGQSARQAVQTVKQTQEVVGLARDLGVTPQQAMQGVRTATQVGKELGVTPQQALSAGVSALRLFGDVSKAAGTRR